jgi:TorA maturation chaperone TorD
VNKVVGCTPEVTPEEQARADIYGLLAHLFYAPPSPELLNAIANAEGVCDDGAESAFCKAWAVLQQSAADADAACVRDEYDAAFVTTGQAPVMLYACFHLSGRLNDRAVIALRDDLARLGIARRPAAGETEDHLSALCDVMRLLIAGAPGVPPAAPPQQQRFFQRHLQPWYGRVADAIEHAPETHFYKHVGRFARAFFDLESESLVIE